MRLTACRCQMCFLCNLTFFGILALRIHTLGFSLYLDCLETATIENLYFDKGFGFTCSYLVTTC